MTLKSYLLLSGGGTLLATYLVTSQPPVAPARPASTTRAAARTNQPDVDIQQEADRLQTRVRQEVEFSAPSRNLFRFGAAPRRAPEPTFREPVEPAPVVPVPEAALPPAPPPIRLSGVYTQDGKRRAVLVTPQGLVEVAEGAAVLTDYRVGRIEEDAVELTARDGATLRLKLRP